MALLFLLYWWCCYKAKWPPALVALLVDHSAAYNNKPHRELMTESFGGVRWSSQHGFNCKV